MKALGRNNHAVVIIVRGRGQLPLDMLRYDCCSPHPDTLADFAAAVSGERETNRGPHEVKLLCWSPGGPTPARWSSFLWACEVVD